VYSSLQFVVGALNAMKSKNPLTESFLIQLDVDLEGTGIQSQVSKSGSAYVHQAMVGILSAVIYLRDPLSLLVRIADGLW
jgi:hypothetical protein